MTSEPEKSNDLSTEEKILRVQELWDEIARERGNVQPTSEQLEEAERRLRRHEESPGEYRTWEEVKRRLQGEQ